MTTDEWKEISKIIEEKDFYKLATEIAVRTYDLDISEQELDRTIKDYAKEPKRLFMMKYYHKGPFGNIKYSCKMIKDITESEALKWYEQDRFCYPMILLFYKKDGEWVFYK